MDSEAEAASAGWRLHLAAWRRWAEILAEKAELPALGAEEFIGAGDGGVGHGAMEPERSRMKAISVFIGWGRGAGDE